MTSTPPHPVADPRQLLLAQVAWWALTYAVVVSREVAGSVELFWQIGIGHFIFSFALSLSCTVALTRLYLALPPRFLTGLRSVPVVGGACLLAGAAWRVADTLHLMMFTD